jgi:threonine aldolase
MIDLISDTATLPTPAMLQAMMSARLGDEQKGEDPTVNALQDEAASLLGCERAMMMPSATMANQVALLLHAGPGDEVLCHDSAHIIHYEAGGVSMHARAQLRALTGARGQFSVDTLMAALRADDPHHPVSKAVVIENTSNGGGGSVWPLANLDAIASAATAHGLAMHVDGARLYNAAVALGVPLARVAQGATTVQMCFSKGLGCPMGAVLGMPASMWPRARRFKQAFGGCVRQGGIIAAGMLHALHHHVTRLQDDHHRARTLAAALTNMGAAVEQVETNLVFFQTHKPVTDLLARLRNHGVRLGRVAGSDRLRACLHLNISDDDLRTTIAALQSELG